MATGGAAEVHFPTDIGFCLLPYLGWICRLQSPLSSNLFPQVLGYPRLSVERWSWQFCKLQRSLTPTYIFVAGCLTNHTSNFNAMWHPSLLDSDYHSGKLKLTKGTFKILKTGCDTQGSKRGSRRSHLGHGATNYSHRRNIWSLKRSRNIPTSYRTRKFMAVFI
jgi:hypothetical protein